jgi:hypothetical protein
MFSGRIVGCPIRIEMSEYTVESERNARRKCDDCLDHKLHAADLDNLKFDQDELRKGLTKGELFDERVRAVGGVVILLIGVTIFIIGSYTNGVSKDQEKHEDIVAKRIEGIATTMRSQNELLVAQVIRMSDNVKSIEKNVALMQQCMETTKEEATKERREIQKNVDKIEERLNRIYGVPREVQ